MFVYDASNLKLYVNGQLDGTNSSLSGEVVDPVGNSSMYFGSRSDQDKLLPGSIDEVVIWNDNLSAAEVTVLYNSGVPLAANSNSGNYTSSANVKRLTGVFGEKYPGLLLMI